MQKYIKNDFSEIRYFKDDVKVSDWIDLKEYRLMTKAEILKHETLRPTEFHTIWVWDNEPSAGHWEDGRTEEEKYATYLTQFTPLTRRQFKLSLLENGLLDTVEQMIGAIEDPTLKSRIQIEYSESERFERTNDSVKYMLGVLNLTSDKVDEMWRYAMTL